MNTPRFTRLAGMGMLAISATIVQASFVNSASAGVPAGEIKVRVSDLDLGKSTDVARLYKRIRTAAESACGVDELTGTRLLSGSQQHCVDEIVATAVANVHNDRLSALHQQGSKNPRAAAHPGSAGKDSLSGVNRTERD